MSRQLRPFLLRTAIIAVICIALGVSGILDPAHAALLGCLLLAGITLWSTGSQLPGAEWPARRFAARAGGRNGVSDLAWQVFDPDRRVQSRVVERVRKLAAARLALLGVDVYDPAQQAKVERMLGRSVAQGLAAGKRPTARTLQLWLDAIDRLGLEPTSHHERTPQ